MPTLTDIKDALNKRLSPITGTASSGSTTTLKDDDIDLEANAHQNGQIRMWIKGKMYERTISSHTSNEFSFSAIGEEVVAGTEYEIIG